MTRQQIKQMMHESKAIEWFDSENMDWLEYVNVFDRFASLVVAAERVAIEEAEKPRQWQGLHSRKQEVRNDRQHQTIYQSHYTRQQRRDCNA
jgi:hypothetical protein